MKKRVFNIVRYVITIPLIFLLAWGTEIITRDIPSVQNLSLDLLIERIIFIIVSVLVVIIAYKVPPKYKGIFVAIASTAWIMHLYDVHIEYILPFENRKYVVKYALALIATIITDVVFVVRFNKILKKSSNEK